MKTFAKKIARKLGLRFDDLVWPYYWTAYNFLQGKAFNPLKITIELTYGCNLRCKMCPLENAKNDEEKPAANSQQELSINELQGFVDDLKKLKVKSILLTGGEPFIKKDIEKLVARIKENNFYCCILSNGYFISEYHAKKLVDAKVDLISFSMDGPQALHNSIRGVEDSFEKICKSIKLIQAEKKRAHAALPRIILNCTISALNQEHISEIIDIAHELGVELVDYMYLFYTDSDKITATKNVMAVGSLKPESQILPDNIKKIDSRKLIQEVNRAKQKAKKYHIYLGFNPPLEDNEIEKRFFDDSFSFSSKCFYPWFETRLDPYGNVYPCSLDVPMGNIRKMPFSRIWNGSQYIDFRNKLKQHKLLPMCAKCCKLVYRYWSNLPTC